MKVLFGFQKKAVDINYLLHFCYFLVAKPYGEFIVQDMDYIRRMIVSGNVDRVFPTNITAFIGCALLLKFVIETKQYHDILRYNNITSYNKNITSKLREYYCFGEFLRNVMQITDLTQGIMKVRYPTVNSQPFDAIQLRMGGKLSDYPLNQQWLSKKSLEVAVQCIKNHFKSYNIYIASDSMYAKNYLFSLIPRL